jgi:hypothetical protein
MLTRQCPCLPLQAKLQNGEVAVKKLSQALDLDEKNFKKEVSCLMTVRHKNIVRFLGYCADTQGKISNYAGKMVMADERERLLCFEFVPNGNLERYIAGMFLYILFILEKSINHKNVGCFCTLTFASRIKEVTISFHLSFPFLLMYK